MQNNTPHRHGERGQTIILIAISLISLLAMAALAIDVVTLYVARSEIQRAADAAALAGAKAIADSGFTSLPTTDSNYASAKLLAQTMATNAINALISFNPVAGTTPTLVTTPSFDFTRQGNPLITVSLRKTNLPTFFARIWGQSSASVTASATAEAYNPANNSPFTPIAPTSVKPWMIANTDTSNPSVQLVNTTTWTVQQPSLIGQPLILTSDCATGPSTCSLSPHNPPTYHSTVFPQDVDYVPALVTANAGNVCPSSCGGGSTYEEGIECADANSYAFLSCGGGSTQAQWDSSVNPGGSPGATATGAECLIHATGAGLGQGQDTLANPAPWPNGPFQITAQSGPQSGNLVTTSNSIVTIPIVDNTTIVNGGGPVTIVGFLQAFINEVEQAAVPGQYSAGDINITVLNIVGCSSSPNTNPTVVGGQGTSPIPVRLITPGP